VSGPAMRGSARGSFGGLFSVAGAVAWRQVYRFFTNPAFLTPALFPIFFFVAFAGGLSRVGQVPGFDFSEGYAAFQFVWSLLQAVALGGAFTGFSIAGDFENGFARRLLLAASNRRGIVLGYVLASAVRATVTGGLVTVVALVAGMSPEGGVDLFGLVGLALLVNVAATLFGAGIAMVFRTQQAGPIIRTPIFLVLFLAPVFVPQQLLTGWISAIAAVNPMTFILEAGRGFLSGEPTGGALAFGIAVATVVLLVPWALFGLRTAEKAG
jgi:ABC-2 type transport system permease protein